MEPIEVRLILSDRAIGALEAMAFGLRDIAVQISDRRSSGEEVGWGLKAVADAIRNAVRSVTDEGRGALVIDVSERR